MRIDYKNKDCIEKTISVHDAVFENLYFDSNNHISFFMKNYCSNKYVSLKFYNVFGFYMQCDEPWGMGSNIFEWVLENELTNNLSKCKKGDEFPFSRLENIDKTIESSFLFSSGNKLNIVCGYIEFEERQLKKSEMFVDK